MRVLSIVTLCALLCTAPALAQPLSPREQFFENQVRPLLIEKCHECHAAALQESDLRLDSRAAVLRGGISGPAARPRAVADSLILQAVRGEGKLEQMPPDNPLDEAQIAVLEKWVQLGLPWTAEDEPMPIALGDQQAIRAASVEHWAFKPVGNPQPPHVDASLSSYINNPIDLFVVDSLASAGLSPNPLADRRSLIRRIYFDVIGLPPSLEHVAAFVRDTRDTQLVVEELVDDLLASEQYGERWARYWLDLARYADTQDWQAQADLRYPFAYTYRDYVIQSLNSDKPYDQFLREQIAADFYAQSKDAPKLAALGLLTVGPRFRNDKLEIAADQIDVVCRGLMALTVSCARCHDHKYDPVPIEDYYSLQGVFASSVMPNDFPALGDYQIDPALFADYQRERASREQDLDVYKSELRNTAIADIRKRLPVYFDGFAQLSIDKSAQLRSVVSTLKVLDSAMFALDSLLVDRLKSEDNKADAVLKPWTLGLAANEAIFKKNAKQWLDDWVADESINPIVREQLAKDRPATRAKLVATYGTLFAAALKASDDDSTYSELRSRLLDEDGLLDLEDQAVLVGSRIAGKGRKDFGDLQKAIGEVDSSHPGSPPRAMTLIDLKTPVTPVVLLRGEANRRGDRVPRQFLSILEGDDRQPFSDGSGRRELAEAITDPMNPLTFRVLVNRVWARYFGRGMVSSLDDFGLRSDPPTHPELLDWLSSEFLRNDQSLKFLHRMILTSRTYQQASSLSEAGTVIDPENRLLWRQNRRRLDFEAMRDAMLEVAGSLDAKVGGRSVRLTEQPMTTRRSLYAYVDRNEMDPMLRTFDFASPTASAASRAETTIPQQALFSMNHPFVADLARSIALACDRADDEAKVQDLYRRVFQRPARESEVNVAMEFLAEARPGDLDGHSDWQYGFGPLAAIGDAKHKLKAFPHWTGQAYQGSAEFPDPNYRFLRLTADGGHPGNVAEEGTVRRWTAPGTGTINIRGKIVHTRDNSDGVIAIIHGKSVDQTFNALKSEVDTHIDGLAVQAGEVIDFVVSPGKSPSADTYTWVVKIQGVGGELQSQSWDSQADFHAPPPPPLSPLAQLAQALLLTNEFLYVD